MLSAELMKEVRRLQIRARRRVDDLLMGEYHSAFRGQGVEFAEVREYEPGDDVRTIDWNVTARTGKPFIKRFVEERQMTVMLAVDLSASEGFGSSGQLKSRLAVELSAVLALAATRNNDRVGLVVFTDGVELHVPPKKGRSHVLRVMRELLAFEPRGRGTDLAGTIEHLDRVLTKRAIVFLVSDFLAPVQGNVGFAKPMQLLGRRHDTIAVVVGDQRERELPRVGLVQTVDPETGQARVIDTSSVRGRRAYTRAHDQQKEAMGRAFMQAGVDRIDVSTDRPFVNELMRYFQLRERRR